MRRAWVAVVVGVVVLWCLVSAAANVWTASGAGAQQVPAPLPPLVEDYANYPATPQAILGTGCTAGSVVGFEFSLQAVDATGALGPPSPFVPDLDLLPEVQTNDVVTMRWQAVAPACVGSAIALLVKASSQPFFDPTRDQITPRAAGGGIGDDAGYQVGILTGPGPGTIALKMPDLSVLIPLFPDLGLDCDYQLDGIVGVPLRDVGPSGSFFSAALRQQFGVGPQPPAPGADVTTVFSDRNSTYEVCAAQTTTTTAPVTTTPLTVPSSTTTPPTTAPPSSTTPSASTTPPTAPRTSQTPPPTFVQYDTPTPSTRPPLAATGTDRELRLRLTPGVLTVLGVCLVGTGLTLVLATRRARRRV